MSLNRVLLHNKTIRTMIDKTIKVIKDINKIIDSDFESMFQKCTNVPGADETNGIMYTEYEHILCGLKDFEKEYYSQKRYKEENLSMYDN